VYFVNAGEKALKDPPLRVVTGEAADNVFLDNRIKGSRKGAVHTSIPDAITNFLATFPEGFSDPKYLKDERNYKVEAHQLMTELLGPRPFAKLLKAKEHDGIVSRALKVVSKTNLIFPQEKMALNDGLKSDEAKSSFSNCLHDLLHGTGEAAERFMAWATHLASINAAKWTIASYFPFILHIDKYMFIKPTPTKSAASACGFEINYTTALNWQTYDSVQNFATVLREHIGSMKPRDMIDVQTFIWYINRTPRRAKARR